MPAEKCDHFEWRKELPAEAVGREDITIWSVLKQAVGKDLTRITIPIVYCEPISFLQRFAEYLEYSELLKKADQCDDRLERLEYITAFAVSTLSCSHKRMAKPFNPLLFETFELDRSEHEGYRFVAEQVSHHPPISAFHTEADAFEFYGTVSPKIRFWGISIEVQTGGVFTVRLKKHNETYTWKSLNCIIHNIIIGELYLTLDGHLHVECSSGLGAKVKVGKNAYSQCFEGYITNEDEVLESVYGDWTKFCACCSKHKFEKKYKEWQDRKLAHDNESASTNGDFPLIEGSRVLWKARPRPAKADKMYHFTNFTLLLNDPAFITDDLPRTDCRLRQDIRLLEEKKIDEAAFEKNRLEEKQREARAVQAKTNAEKLPRWFDKQKSKDGSKSWTFNGKYWDRDFADCEDIY